MTRALLPLFVLAACETSSIQLGDDTGALDDTGVSDTDTQDTDTEDADTEPVYVTDFSEWDGYRRFIYDSSWYSCDETVYETGFEIAEGDRDWDELHGVCASCDHFYEISPEQDSACDGYLQLGTTWRGISVTGGAEAVYLYRESNGDLEEYGSDTHADFEDETFSYAYDFEIYYVTVDVEGEVTFPLVLAE